MTVFWWRMVLVPVMLLFCPSLPGLTPNRGLRQPGLVFGVLLEGERGPGPERGQPGEPFIFLRGRYL